MISAIPTVTLSYVAKRFIVDSWNPFREWFLKSRNRQSNKALHLTAIPLCSIAAGELGRKKRRGTPTDIKGIKAAQYLAVDFHFSEERLQEIGNLMEGGCGIKVTVAAFTPTEGDVDVKTGGTMVVHSFH